MKKNNKFNIIVVDALMYILSIIFIVTSAIKKENISEFKFYVIFSFGVIILVLAICLSFFIGRKISTFTCEKCGTDFSPGIITYGIAIHINGKSYLKCPKCKTKLWCKNMK